ncbi:MAG: YerC/YecD family TrpR-related protein, partial [Clostridia bacterium]|nr:YerC/YecD family TrpR-related protein [Clostridia bacterium]
MDEYVPKLRSAETDALFDALLSLKDRGECYRFFEDICTIAELKSIAQRW